MKTLPIFTITEVSHRRYTDSPNLELYHIEIEATGDAFNALIKLTPRTVPLYYATTLIGSQITQLVSITETLDVSRGMPPAKLLSIPTRRSFYIETVLGDIQIDEVTLTSRYTLKNISLTSITSTFATNVAFELTDTTTGRSRWYNHAACDIPSIEGVFDLFKPNLPVEFDPTTSLLKIGDFTFRLYSIDKSN